jgi:hypothetical protein
VLGHCLNIMQCPRLFYPLQKFGFGEERNTKYS